LGSAYKEQIMKALLVLLAMSVPLLTACDKWWQPRLPKQPSHEAKAAEPEAAKPQEVVPKDFNLEKPVGVFYAAVDGFNVYVDPQLQTFLCKLPMGSQYFVLEDNSGFLKLRLDKMPPEVSCPDDISYAYVKKSEAVAPSLEALAKTPAYTSALLTDEALVYRNPVQPSETPVCILSKGVYLLKMQAQPLKIQMPKSASCPVDANTAFLVDKPGLFE
jgi:hypothetical protein